MKGGKGWPEHFGLGAAPPSTTIFVAGLPPGIDKARLWEVFSAYGEVTWCSAMREGRDGRVAALVEFSNLEHATWVVANVHGGIPQGLDQPVDVKFKDERPGFGPCAKGGGGKGAGRFSPYGPPDSTSFEACFQHAYDTAYTAPYGAGMGMGAPMGLGAPSGKPAGPTMPSDNLFVRGLPTHIDDDTVRQIFSSFGNVTQCRVLSGTGIKRTALVRFESVEEAAFAIQSCTGMIPAGLSEPIDVKFSESGFRHTPTPMQRTVDTSEFSIEVIVKGFEQSGLMPGGTGAGRHENNSCALYIAGLPTDTTDWHLYKMFSPMGPISPRGVHALMNDDGSCKGIAFVNYLREDSVHAAIGVYHGAILPDGNRLRVQQKQQKPQPQVLAPPDAKTVPPPPGGINANIATGASPAAGLPPGDTGSQGFTGADGAVPATAWAGSTYEAWNGAPHMSPPDAAAPAAVDGTRPSFEAPAPGAGGPPCGVEAPGAAGAETGAPTPSNDLDTK